MKKPNNSKIIITVHCLALGLLLLGCVTDKVPGTNNPVLTPTGDLKPSVEHTIETVGRVNTQFNLEPVSNAAVNGFLALLSGSLVWYSNQKKNALKTAVKGVEIAGHQQTKDAIRKQSQIDRNTDIINNAVKSFT